MGISSTNAYGGYSGDLNYVSVPIFGFLVVYSLAYKRVTGYLICCSFNLFVLQMSICLSTAIYVCRVDCFKYIMLLLYRVVSVAASQSEMYIWLLRK